MNSLSSKKIIALLLCIVMVCASASEVFAANNTTKAKTLRLTKYEGSVTVKNASGKTQKTKSDMKLYSGYTIRTAKNGIAYISLDDKKAIKLDSLTEVEIRKSGKKLEVYLSEGNLFFNVTDKLSSDETLNIRTNTMVTGIRGTSGTFATNAITSKIILTDGKIDAKDVNNNQTVKIQAGEMLTLDIQTSKDTEKIETEPNITKIENLCNVLPAFAAEEIAKDTQLSERVAPNFNIKAEELVKQIEEALPEMKARDEQQREEQSTATTGTSSFTDFVSGLKTSWQKKQQAQSFIDYGYSSFDPEPKQTTYTVSLPTSITTAGSVEPIITFDTAAFNSDATKISTSGSTITYTVLSGSDFYFSVSAVSGASITAMNGASLVSSLPSTDNKTTYIYRIKSITADIAITEADCTYTYESSTYTVTLPENIPGIVTFTAIDDTTSVTPGSVIRFYVQSDCAEFIFTNASIVKENIPTDISNNEILYKTSEIYADTAIEISSAAIRCDAIDKLTSLFNKGIPVTINDNNGDLTPIGDITINSNNILTIENYTNISIGNLINNGTINIKGSLKTTGNVRNNDVGTINIFGTLEFANGVTNSGIINNFGTLTLNGSYYNDSEPQGFINLYNDSKFYIHEENGDRQIAENDYTQYPYLRRQSN